MEHCYNSVFTTLRYDGNELVVCYIVTNMFLRNIVDF